MDKSDGMTLGPRIMRGPVHEHIARIGLIDTRQHFDDRGFSGTILAKQRKDFTTRQIETDIVDRQSAAKRLHHPAQR